MPLAPPYPGNTLEFTALPNAGASAPSSDWTATCNQGWPVTLVTATETEAVGTVTIPTGTATDGSIVATITFGNGGVFGDAPAFTVIANPDPPVEFTSITVTQTA